MLLPRGNSRLEVQQMQAAVIEARQCRRQLLQARNSYQINQDAGTKPARFSLHNIMQAWQSTREFQISLLEAEFEVVRLAAAGTKISDYNDRCKNPERCLEDGDIAFEIERLFALIVRPINPVRQYYSKSTITDVSRESAHRAIIRMLTKSIATFFKMADVLVQALLSNVAARIPDARVRLGLFRVLMFTSDCFRYSLDHDKSSKLARLMNITNPRDPEAHMRLGMNLAMLNDENSLMEPFFHYCFFLANRKVPIGHSESVVVAKFVKSITTQHKKIPQSTTNNPRGTFFRSFIVLLWNILSSDLDTATKGMHDKELWDSFKRMVDEGLSETDMLHMVGVLIFTHHRMSPRGNASSAFLPQRELCDSIVGKIIRIISRNMQQTLQDVNCSVRARKKNRRRANQKKRRFDGSNHKSISKEALGFEVFETIVDLQKSTPDLGGLSVLAEYWSQARSAPSPSADISPLARTYNALQGITAEIQKLEELTCTSRPASFILSRVISDTQDQVPAMPEDVKFCHFLPCQHYDMFHDITLPEVPLCAVFGQAGDEGVRKTLTSLADQSYESFVSTIATKHLQAFSTLIAREVSTDECKLGKKAARTLVALVVRKQRLLNLIADLAKVGGGQVTRMSLPSGSESLGGSLENNLSQSEVLPSPAQPMEIDVGNEDDENCLPLEISESRLRQQVRKRRRIFGSFTTGISDSPMANGHYRGPTTQSPQEIDELRGQQTETHRRPIGTTPVERRDKPRTPRLTCELLRYPASYGGILSQNYLRLTLAQGPPTPPPETVSEEDSKDLSTLLREMLYPPDAEPLPTPIGLRGPTFWRNPPSDEYASAIFDTQTWSLDA